MTEPARLLFFAGSARRGSFNKQLARLAASIAKLKGHEATFVDLADYQMPIYDGDLEAAHGPPRAAREFKALLEKHDGVMVACPEYNAGISPLLKNTLDWVSRLRAEDGSGSVFRKQVFLLASAAPGGMGGLRGLSMVRQVLELGLGALVLPDQVAVSRAATAFAEDGSLTNAEAQERLTLAIGKLAHMAKVLHR